MTLSDYIIVLTSKVNEFTHHFHGLAGVCLIDLHIWNKTTGAIAENLKFYSKWTVYLLSTSAYQN